MAPETGSSCRVARSGLLRLVRFAAALSCSQGRGSTAGHDRPLQEASPRDAEDEPDHAGQGDEGARGPEADAVEPGPTMEPHDDREEDREDRQLPRLHSDVEGDERRGHRPGGEADLAEGAGEAEAVDEAE